VGRKVEEEKTLRKPLEKVKGGFKTTFNSQAPVEKGRRKSRFQQSKQQKGKEDESL